ncbi:hypothetical protein RIF29_20325 [Crotalaria pallida]|uniref:AP2/ERF domain-containing protein n=1 Tax=Crotalaria pallida TaxID=3830 RepID=A0AAN9F0X1_CROPI
MPSVVLVAIHLLTPLIASVPATAASPTTTTGTVTTGTVKILSLSFLRHRWTGGYDMEEKAARAYDLAALKYWGSSTHINFPLEDYQMQLEEMQDMSRQEYVAHLRRKRSGFSRRTSIYKGVTSMETLSIFATKKAIIKDKIAKLQIIEDLTKALEFESNSADILHEIGILFDT